jgi:NAD dependent epimerase/dehydratase
MKKVLVTGAAGFIGSHLTELLVSSGLDVRVFVRYNSKNNWGWLEGSDVLKHIEIITGDIRDYDSVLKAVNGCESVYHLAALIGIPYSYISPKAYIDTNIIGTYNILQSSKEIGVNKVIVTSTSETYGTAQYVPIDEIHPLCGQSPYSASKIGADHLSISYYKSFQLPVKIVRAFNTYGPRQSARAIIPTIIAQILSGKTKIKIGNVLPTRDLTFVKDTVSGFLAIANSDDLYGEVTNIGMNKEISISDLADMIIQLIGVETEIISDSSRIRPENSEVERLWCENSKILTKTNWKPQYSLEKGLIETIEWISQNKNHYKPDLYNV